MAANTETDRKLTDAENRAAKQRRAEFDAICAVEGIFPSVEQQAMFDMFERERWSHERRLQHVIERARKGLPL
jgi:hypothetical protein